MKSKEEIVTDMCQTYRPDFNLDKDPNGPPWVAGMTMFERRMLRLVMEQIYDEHVGPIYEQYMKLNNETKIRKTRRRTK